MTDDRARRLEHIAKLHLAAVDHLARTLTDSIRMLAIFNGGALVALLALIGSLARNGVVFPPQTPYLFGLFGIGLFAAAGAGICFWFASGVESLSDEIDVLGSTRRISGATFLEMQFTANVAGTCGGFALLISLALGVFGVLLGAWALHDLGETLKTAAPARPS